MGRADSEAAVLGAQFLPQADAGGPPRPRCRDRRPPPAEIELKSSSNQRGELEPGRLELESSSNKDG